MEPAAAWGPSCEFQLANWTVEEPAAEVWAPAVGLPLEYASSDIFGTCPQAYVPESIGEKQLVEFEYNYSSASRHNLSPEAIVVDGQNRHEVVDPQKLETRIVVSNDSYATNVFNQVEHAFKVDINLMAEKMHRYPAGLGDTIGESYTVRAKDCGHRPLPPPPRPSQAGREGEAHGCHMLRQGIWTPIGGDVCCSRLHSGQCSLPLRQGCDGRYQLCRLPRYDVR